MNLLDKNQQIEDASYLWLANMLVLVVVVILGTLAVARYLCMF
jgi:hypothetical protein